MFVIADVSKIFTTIYCTEGQPCLRRMRSKLPKAGIRVGFDRMAGVLDIFENYLNDRLNGNIFGIDKSFRFLERCGKSRVRFFVAASRGISRLGDR